MPSTQHMSNHLPPTTLPAQAEDRAHRIGQKREVLVLVMVTAGTIEEAILDKAKQKREIDAKVIQAGMFNDHSTHEQRQAVLRAIMSRGAGGVADAVHDEGEVNEMLARTPEELELFMEMDEQWHAANPGKSRLITEAEVPSWVLQQGEDAEGGVEDGEGSQEEEEDAGGRRLRKRRRTGGYADEAAALDAYVLGGRGGLHVVCICVWKTQGMVMHVFCLPAAGCCWRVMVMVRGVMGHGRPSAHADAAAHQGAGNAVGNGRPHP